MSQTATALAHGVFTVHVRCLFCFRVIAFARSAADAPKRDSLLCPFCNTTLPTEGDSTVDKNEGATWGISYQEYLHTPRWQALRAAAIERFHRRCALCNSDKNLQVHHREYPEVLGQEEQEYLTVLCCHCHDLFHRYSKARIMRRKS